MKKVVASMKIAFGALLINKLRSALTMLGIIIGVAAVIAMVAVGAGAQVRIQQQIASIGSNIIIVLSGSVTSSGVRAGNGNAQTLTEDDAKALANDSSAVQAAAPVSRGGAQVVYGNQNWGTQILGTTPDYLIIRDLQVDEGQPFTSADVDAAAKVALLGKTVATNLFNGEDPVGKGHDVTGRIGGREDRKEFIATEPRRVFSGLEARLEPVRNFAKHRVSSGMAEHVVDFLETVEIEVEESEALVVVLRLANFGPKPLEEGAAVGKAGQGVEMGEVVDAPFRGFLFGEIAH